MSSFDTPKSLRSRVIFYSANRGVDFLPLCTTFYPATYSAPKSRKALWRKGLRSKNPLRYLLRSTPRRHTPSGVSGVAPLPRGSHLLRECFELKKPLPVASSPNG